jgi:hypothetical protein
VQLEDDRAHLVAGQDDGKVFRPLGPDHIFEPGQVLVQDVAVKEEERAQRLVLDPTYVGLLGATTTVAKAVGLANTVEKPGRGRAGRGGFPNGEGDVRRSGIPNVFVGLESHGAGRIVPRPGQAQESPNPYK